MAGIRVYHVVEVHKYVVDRRRGPAFGIALSILHGFPQQTSDVVVFQNGLGVFLEILIHIDLQEGENTDLTLGRDRPAQLCYGIGHLRDVFLKGFLAQGRERDVVFGMELEAEGGVDNDIILGHADLIGLDGGFVFKKNGRQEDGGAENRLGGGGFLPMDKAKGHVCDVDTGFLNSGGSSFMDVLKSGQRIGGGIIE